MLPSPDVNVTIDLNRVRENAQAIASATGRPLLAVVKADAYGLGATDVAQTLADIASGFYVFRPQESLDAELDRFGGKHIVALQCAGASASDLIGRSIHPVVWELESTAAWRAAKPVLSIDTGQGRFGCEPSQVAAIVAAGDITEAMTHATTIEQVERFGEALRDAPAVTFRHAAGSALLSQPSAWLDVVRPGLALYEGAVRVTARLVEVRDSRGQPAGYTGFRVERYGVILIGYSNGVRRGPCAVNDRITQLLEVGMQSAFVALSPGDVVGDEVQLLGDRCDAQTIAHAWGASAQEVIFRLSRSGVRHVIGR